MHSMTDLERRQNMIRQHTEWSDGTQISESDRADQDAHRMQLADDQLRDVNQVRTMTPEQREFRIASAAHESRSDPNDVAARHALGPTRPSREETTFARSQPLKGPEVRY